MRQVAKGRSKKNALERELTIAIQEADSSPQEGKSPDAVRALIRRWRLISLRKPRPGFSLFRFRHSPAKTRERKICHTPPGAPCVVLKANAAPLARRRLDREVAWLFPNARHRTSLSHRSSRSGFQLHTPYTCRWLDPCRR